MTIAQWMLLAFALWTILVPLGAVGLYRLHQVLTGQATMNAFPADGVTGPDWYRRAMRAHANAVENLPVFATLVLLAALVLGPNRSVDVLAVVVLTCRTGQSLVHLAFVQTARVVAVRFTLFVAQVLGMVGIGVQLVMNGR